MHGNARAPENSGAGGTPRPRIAFALPQVPAAPNSPPIALDDTDGSALQLTALSAQTQIDGPLAETTLHLTFHNPESRVREGRFRIVLPRGAFLSRLAMKIDGVFRDADVAELARAREVYESVMHVRRDPLLVEQHGDDELSARVFPIAASADKEIVVTWIATVSAEEPVTLRLRGIGEIDRLDVVGTQNGQVLAAVHREHVGRPEDVPMTPWPLGSSVRNGDLVVARVVVPPAESEATTSPIDGGLVVLVDTSASRAPELEKQLVLLHGLVSALAVRAPAAAQLTVAAFDQRVVPVYRGGLSAFGAPALAALRARGALGASDLERALVWSATEARAVRATRAIIIGDGLATAGSADATRLRGAARALGASGIERLDFVALGDVRGDTTMRALAVGALRHDGMVIDGTRPVTEIATRLTLPSRSQVQVGVPGARWVWPTSFDGVQPGDERFVYAEVPSGERLAVHVDGHAIPLTPLHGPITLLTRALAKAKVDALVAHGEAHGYDDALRDRIVTLAKAKRVPSPFTAFLVTESEADRAALLRPAPPRVSFPSASASASPSASAPASASPSAHGPPHALARAPAPLPTTHGRIPGAHVTKPPMVRMASVQVNGRLPPEAIQGVVRQNFGRFRACYDLGLLRRGHLEGRVATKFVIDYDGSVRTAVDAGSDIGDSDVVDCVVAAFREVRFARPEGGIVTVTYPIVFRQLEKDGTLDESRASERSPMALGPTLPLQPRRTFLSPSAAEPPIDPWTGPYATARAAIAHGDADYAVGIAAAARTTDSRDVIALLTLGESLEAAALPELAARAYGSIADLYPHSAEMLRVAAGRLDALGADALPLAIELWRRAKDDRPDHPAGHHALAMALLRAGAHEEAYDTLATALATRFDGRYGNAHGLLDSDLAFVAGAWAAAEPARANLIEANARRDSTQYPLTEPSLRFVLSWETDASDLDLALFDAAGASTGTIQTAVNDGYGPDALLVSGQRSARRPTRARVHFTRRGPTGIPIGLVHVMEQDGRGHVSVRPRPFVVMNQGAEVDLGTFD